jgi:hypothetical protein
VSRKADVNTFSAYCGRHNKQIFSDAIASVQWGELVVVPPLKHDNDQPI